MKANSKKTFLVIGVSIAIIAFCYVIVNNYQTKTSLKYSSKTAEDLEPEQNSQDRISEEVNKNATKEIDNSIKNEILKILPYDVVLGEKDAPILVIEYASLSCPHCASFVREAFPKLKKDFIDKGKVKFIYRDFPLNQPALTAAIYAKCDAGDYADKYFKNIKTLYKTQDSWAFDRNYVKKLQTIAKLNGTSETEFNHCLKNKTIQERLLQQRLDAAESLRIKSTPSFFINGEALEGYVDYLTLKKVIKKHLNK